MATGKISAITPVTVSDYGGNVKVIRSGKLRILSISTSSYTNIKSITLAAFDRPSAEVRCAAVIYAGTVNIRLGMISINTSGTINCQQVSSYNNGTTGFSQAADSNTIAGVNIGYTIA